MRVFYSESNYGEEEISAALEVLSQSRLALMNGENVREVEGLMANLFRKKYALMTNSGSSANLLAMLSYKLPKDSLVLTPALTFSTTVSPIVHAGCIPLFVDVDPETLQIDPNLVEEAFKKYKDKIKALMVPNLIGNIADWNALKSISEKYGSLIIEDSADTVGYKIKSNYSDWSDISTTSMYASHVITGAGFGGVVCFNDLEAYEYSKSLRSWGRRSSKYEEGEDFNRRFSVKIDGLDYDDKYVFDDLGYNLIPSEISAAFAKVQILKLNENIQGRIKNFKYLKNELNHPAIKTFSEYPGVKTGWLAFPIKLQGLLDGMRKDFQIFLESNEIQTRTIFTGNILRQPVAEKFKSLTFGDFKHSDDIMKNGVLLGCHNRMTKDKIEYLLTMIKEYLHKNT